MISFFIPLIYLLLAGTAGTIIFGSKKFGSALPFSLMLHTSIIIISGLLFGDLRTGLYFGILIFAFAIIKAVFADRCGIAIIKAILSVDTLIYCVLYLILFILNSKQVYSTWDELSHWGPMAKEMFRLNDFYFKSDRTFAHRDYVPFITVFEYIVCKMGGAYREATVYQAVQMFMLSLFMPLIGQIEEAVKGKKRIIIELVCTVGVLSSMIILNSCFSFFHIIYTDLPFGLICGFGMAHTYFCDTNKKYSQTLLELIVIMTAIIMTKMMGIIFVPVILVMTWLIFTKGIPVMNKLKIIIPQVMIPIALWLAYKAESKRYTSISGGQSFDGAFGGIVTILTKGFQYDYQKEVSDKYIRAVTSEYNLIASDGTYLKLVLLGVILSLFVIALSVAAHKMLFSAHTEKGDSDNAICIRIGLNKSAEIYPDNVYKSAMLTLGMLLTGIYYAVWMYVLYQVSFGEYEATRLASYSRYMCSYIASIVVMLFYLINRQSTMLIGAEEKIKNNLRRYSVFCFAVLLICVVVWYDNASGRFQNEYNGFFDKQYPSDIQSKSESLLEILPNDDNSILFVQQNANGSEFIFYNYFMMDKVGTSTWRSIRLTDEEKYEGDVWSITVTPQELLNVFSDYNYVYMDVLDENFGADYGELFDVYPVEGNVYRVIQSGETVLLEYVTGI